MRNFIHERLHDVHDVHPSMIFYIDAGELTSVKREEKKKMKRKEKEKN